MKVRSIELIRLDMKKLLAILVFISISSIILAQESLLKQANQLYSDGKYTEAIAAYESILASRSESAALYYNLGNSYYKSGMIPQAILNYERALRLEPNDEDVAFNLQVVNSMVVDKMDQVPEFFLTTWMRSFRQSASLETWTGYTIVSFLLLLISIALYFLSGRSTIKKSVFVAGIMLLVVFGISFSNAKAWHNDLTHNKAGIIFSPSAMVKGSPDAKGTDLFMLHEGTKVELMDSIGEWTEIRLINGNEGWIERKHLEII